MITLEGHMYPDGINTPKDMIDYVCAVYGINEPDLLISTIKEICVMSQKAEYDGWFSDYFDEWINTHLEHRVNPECNDQAHNTYRTYDPYKFCPDCGIKL